MEIGPEAQAIIDRWRTAAGDVEIRNIDEQLRLDRLLWGRAYERRTRHPDGTVERERIDPTEIVIYVAESEDP